MERYTLLLIFKYLYIDHEEIDFRKTHHVHLDIVKKNKIYSEIINEFIN